LRTRQKKYDRAAESFEPVDDPEALYWRARAVYRSQGMESFERLIPTIKKRYPKSKYLAELILSLADEKRRLKEFSEAEELYREILRDFPGHVEEALWGLGWMYYTNKNYERAEKVFLQLNTSKRSNGQYLYWQAKSREMNATENCTFQKVNFKDAETTCSELGTLYSSLLDNTGYYGFLAQNRLKKFSPHDDVKHEIPVTPVGEIYKRIEALKLLGLSSEAKDEIKMALKLRKSDEEFKYLAGTAFELGEYRSILYIAESFKNKELLSFAYPLGFWGIVSEIADKNTVDPHLILALIREESRFDPDAVSSSGALGLMQLMPYTAHRVKKDIVIELGDDSEIHDIQKNISLGTYYFSKLLQEFGEIPLAIGAYNAGENAMRRWLFDSQHNSLDEFIEDIPYKETRNYVKKVLKSYWKYKTLLGLPLAKAID
jgi:soluble lytic murein transglycosylase